MEKATDYHFPFLNQKHLRFLISYMLICGNQHLLQQL